MFVYAVSAGAMLVPVFYFDFWSVLLSFLVLEAMVGMFNSCGATLRSRRGFPFQSFYSKKTCNILDVQF